MFQAFFRKRPAFIAAIVVTEFVTVAALVFAARQVFIKCSLYLAGVHGPDMHLYFTMGTAIRNGLTIYRDVFDPKPPAIFLFSALSQSLFHGGALLFVANVIILLCIPCIFIFWGWRHSKTLTQTPRRLALQFSLLVGLTFALYHATIGGDVQTEFYGAFFALLYLAAVDLDRRRPRLITLIIASLSFAMAVFFKEPFVLTLLASALLLFTTRREWLRLFGVPLLTACAMYGVALLALGSFSAYFSVYLRGMLGNYILTGGPVWARGLVAWERILTNFSDFTPWFLLLVLLLFILSLPQSSSRRFLGPGLIAAFISLILIVRSFFPAQFPWHVPFSLSLVLFVLSGVAVVVSVVRGPNARSQEHKGLLDFIRRTWRHALAFYLTVTAIALGSGFHGQYFALALPLYAAFFLLFLRRHASVRDGYFPMPIIPGLTILTGLILLTSSSFLPPATTLAQADAQIRFTEQRDRTAAESVDHLLTACSVDRYYFLEESDYMPYTAHSPLNYYLFTRIEHIGRYHPEFFDESFRRLAQSQIIILGGAYTPLWKEGNALEECLGKSVQQFLAQHFTSTPWSCSRSLSLPSGYSALYRKDPADHAGPDITACQVFR